MKTLVVASTFAAVAFAACPAAACDWNRQASTDDKVAATAITSPQPAQATPASPQAPSVASETTSKPVDVAAPVVLVNDRH